MPPNDNQHERGYNPFRMTTFKESSHTAWVEATPSLKSSHLHLLCVLSLALFLTGCSLTGASDARSLPTSQDISPTIPTTLDAQLTPTLQPSQSSSTPEPAETHKLQAITLAVPARWSAAVELALQIETYTQWHVTVSDDPAGSLDLGIADVALVNGSDGILVTQRPLALSLPFYSSWVDVSETEAWTLTSDPLPGIMVVDWAEIPYASRALRVEGKLPGEAGYPLQQTWSLEYKEGYESEVKQLAETLEPYLSQDEVVYLVAVGDVMLDRALGQTLREGNLTYPFSEVNELITAADLAVGNLESAIGESGTPEKKGYTFQAPSQAAQSLALAGFDLMSLANNHALDFGANALMEGIGQLDEQGISVVGAGENQQAAHTPILKHLNGLTLAFLAYVDVPVEVRGFDTRRWIATETRAGIAWADPKRIQEDILAVQSQADLILVLLHSGYEGVVQPSPPQVAAAHAAIDAGAHLVIGHHAHVLQGLEFYNGGVIVYGLGNFAFEDGGFDQSAILQLWLDRGGVRALEIIPVLLETSGRPNPLADAEASLIRQWFYSTTTVLDTR